MSKTSWFFKTATFARILFISMWLYRVQSPTVVNAICNKFIYTRMIHSYAVPETMQLAISFNTWIASSQL